MKRMLFLFIISFIFIRPAFSAPSVTLNIPNSFSPQTTIQSAQVNSNFSTTATTYNSHTHTDVTQVGTITTGNWNATSIPVQYGGTGNNWSAIVRGGIPYFSALGTLSVLSTGASGLILQTQGAGADPIWGTLGWGRFARANYTGSTGTINDSYNVTSITNTGVGNETINFAITFGNANYTAVPSTSSSEGLVVLDNYATTTIRVLTYNRGTGANQDGDPTSIIVFGD